jgi:XTP/dITP diphosphohydrolase
MIKAYRIQDKVKGIGFDFPTAEEAWKKVEEELSEFHAETDADKEGSRTGRPYFPLSIIPVLLV